MVEGPSLTEKLAEIKKAQGQKVAKAAEEAKLEEAHGEALEENEAREAQAQVEVSREALATELKALEGEFAAAKEEARDAREAIVGAEKMLATDSSLDPETISAIEDLIKNGNERILRLTELEARKTALEAEIAALDGKPGEDKVSEKQGPEGANESAGLENKIASAGDLKSLYEILGSVDYISDSSGERVSTKGIIEGMRSLKYGTPEWKEAVSSRAKLEAYLAGKGVTEALGIRDKAVDEILNVEEFINRDILAILENKIGSAKDMESLFKILESVDHIKRPSGEEVSTRELIEGIESLSYKAPELLKGIVSSRDKLDAYLASKGVTRALGIRDKAIAIIMDAEAMTPGHEAPVAEVAPVAEAPKVESAQESTEAGLKARIESATNIEAMANALRRVEFVKTTSGEKAKSSDMIATIRELYYMPFDISGDLASDDIDKYLMNRGVTSELGIRGKAVELIAAEFSHRRESKSAEKIRKQEEVDIDHAEALEEDKGRESPEVAELMRRKELVEEMREERAREKLSTESRRIKVYTEKGQGMTIEEAKVKKAEIGEVDIIMNRFNINALMEAGLLSPEDVVNQIFKPYYEKHESFEECRKKLSVLPKEVIKKLDLSNRKYEKDVSELIKNGMEQAYGRGSVIDRAYAFFQLPDLGSLNTGALAFSGLEPGNGEWTKARDSMVGLFDGENKGSLLIATTGDLPELMFNSVDLGWLNREQVVRWIKDSNETARGSDNESRVISKTLELQEKGYLSAEETEELLK